MITPPPCFRRSGIWCFMHRKTPWRLMRMMRSHSSSVRSAVAVSGCSTPALLKAKSSRPNHRRLRGSRGGGLGAEDRGEGERGGGGGFQEGAAMKHSHGSGVHFKPSARHRRPWRGRPRRPPHRSKRIGSQPSIKGPSDWFTGTVRIDPLFDPNASARAGAAPSPSSPAPGPPGTRIRSVSGSSSPPVAAACKSKAVRSKRSAPAMSSGSRPA